MIATSIFFLASCSSDEPDESNRDQDASLWGEWVENDGNSYVHGYLNFYSDGTGIEGSYESDIEWVNEESNFSWYTVDDRYIYINGKKYEYRCDGSGLDITYPKGKWRSFSEL